MWRILLVRGANMTYLGKREPEIYGTTTAAELDPILQKHAKAKSYALDIFYTNVEGEAINRIYQAASNASLFLSTQLLIERSLHKVCIN